MTRLGIELRFPRPMANTLTARPMDIYIYIYIQLRTQKNVIFYMHNRLTVVITMKEYKNVSYGRTIHFDL